MKYFKIIALLLLSSTLSFYSCNDNKKTVKEDNTKSVEVEKQATKASETTTPPPTTTEPAQNAFGVWHYTCRIGCPGGAGTAAKCETCGNILAHNTDYHGSNSNTNASPLVNPSATPATPAAPEPAQNSAGVWHYTCANGCAGGSGSTGNCATCQGPLAHNAAYH
ncbi:hypothetical protein [Psychroserpens sp.]|uniref:hypothetical protein n=1 Tax=Psychroserpens sp. TaxID=2020870 RepID=UPI002B27B78B|nr:hypothetical protein [Psychroserpens sp.]